MSSDDLPRENFPGGDVVPGEGELRISIDKTAYAEILAHSKEEPEVEICGVLIGKLKQDKHGSWLHLQHTIRGEGAKQQGAQVTFTHEAWNHINKVWDRDFPKLGIVGWYHTHPGFDIFLSDMDKFIHKSYFDNPNQVAFVYDPHQGTEGFFRKIKEDIVLLDRYWHGGKPRKIIPMEQRIKATAVAAAGVPADLSVAVATLSSQVKQLELELRDRQAGGFWNTIVVGTLMLFVLLFLCYQIFVKPPVVRLPMADPVTGTRGYIELHVESVTPPMDPLKPVPPPEKK